MLVKCPSCGTDLWVRRQLKCTCGAMLQMFTQVIECPADAMADAIIEKINPTPLLPNNDGIMQLVEFARDRGLYVNCDSTGVDIGTFGAMLARFRLKDGAWTSSKKPVTTMLEVDAILQAAVAEQQELDALMTDLRDSLPGGVA